MENTLRTLLETAKAGCAALEKTAEETASAWKLRWQRARLEGELDCCLTEVGQLVYATHAGDPSSSGDMEQLLTQADKVKAALRENRRELAKLRGFVVCDSCCTENAVSHQYCQECGEKLWP